MKNTCWVDTFTSQRALFFSIFRCDPSIFTDAISTVAWCLYQFVMFVADCVIVMGSYTNLICRYIVTRIMSEMTCSIVGCHNSQYHLNRWLDEHCNIHQSLHGAQTCLQAPLYTNSIAHYEARS